MAVKIKPCTKEQPQAAWQNLQRWKLWSYLWKECSLLLPLKKKFIYYQLRFGFLAVLQHHRATPRQFLFGFGQTLPGPGMSNTEGLEPKENTEIWLCGLIFFCLYLLKMHIIRWTPSWAGTVKINSYTMFPIPGHHWSPTAGPEPHHAGPQLPTPSATSQHPPATSRRWQVSTAQVRSSPDNTHLLKTS